MLAAEDRLLAWSRDTASPVVDLQPSRADRITALLAARTRAETANRPTVGLERAIAAARREYDPWSLRPGSPPPGGRLAPPSVTRSWWPSGIHRPPGAAPNPPAGLPVRAGPVLAAGGDQLTGPARHPSNTRSMSWRTSSRASDRAWPLINSSS